MKDTLGTSARLQDSSLSPLSLLSPAWTVTLQDEIVIPEKLIDIAQLLRV